MQQSAHRPDRESRNPEPQALDRPQRDRLAGLAFAVGRFAGLPFVRLLGFALPQWPWIVLSVLLGVATIGSGIGLMAASAWIIAGAALHPSIAVLGLAIVGVRFFGIARGLFRYLERLVSHEVTFRLLARLRVWYYARLEPLAPAALQRYHSGDLLARVVADVEALEHFYVRVLAPPLVALVVAAGLYVFVAAYDGRLAWVLLSFLALAGLGVPLLVHRFSLRAGREMATTRADLSSALVDGIQGLPDLLLCGREGAQLARIDDLGRALGRRQAQMAALRGAHIALISLLTGLAVSAILALAIPMVRAGHLTGVDLAVLALTAAAGFEAVQPLSLAAQHLETSLEAARRLFAVVDTTPGFPAPPASPRPVTVEEGRDEACPRRPESPGGEDLLLAGVPARPSVPGLRPAVLEVRALGFRYEPAGPPALVDLSFRAMAGASLAIVGPSGSGKSTLVNLLLRFWDYQEGHIWLHGRDLRSWRVDDVRAQVSVVAQRTHLFNATIRDNLLLARPDAGQAALERAIRAAELQDFIQALPDGYDTWIGEQGLRLSGGERQRLAIARALLKDAPLLVLDEATANLDPLTEQAVLATVRRVTEGRTTLMITHRLAGLEAADEILVLDSGRVVEQGRHETLLRQDGLYRRLWAYQARAAIVESL